MEVAVKIVPAPATPRLLPSSVRDEPTSEHLAAWFQAACASYSNTLNANRPAS